MQKPEGAENPQGQAQSYVVGVYLGDGCVDTAWKNKDGTERKRFRLRVIDEDFVTYTAEQIKAGYGIDCRFGMDKSKRHGKKPLHMLTCMEGLGEELESITGKRRWIPNFVYESDDNIRAMLEGLLDSEGWVTHQFQDMGRFYLQVGIAMTSELMAEIHRLLDVVGAGPTRIRTKKYPSGRIMKTTLFKTDKFLASGLEFHCWRKQRKIEGYKMAREIIEQSGMYHPNGASFNDYKQEFREAIANHLRTNV